MALQWFSSPQTAYRLAIAIVLAVSAVPLVAYVRFVLAGGPELNDFFVFWAAAKSLAQAPAQRIYDVAEFYSFEQGLIATQIPGDDYPQFSYPPFALLLFAPFALIDLKTGWLLWDGLSLALLLSAVWYGLGRRPWMMAAALLAPATVVSLNAGQTSLLVSALALAGLSLCEKRPMLGGALLGLLAIKPQIAALPLAVLLFTGHYRAVAAALVTIAVLCLTSTFAFGIEVWPAWFKAMGNFAGHHLREYGKHPLNITVTLALADMGVSRTLALAVQALVSLAVLICLAIAVRTRRMGSAQVVAVLSGILLFTPYAMYYDMAVITAVCLYLGREAAAARLNPLEAWVAAAAWFLPALTLTRFTNGALVLPLLAALFVVALRRARAHPPANASPA